MCSCWKGKTRKHCTKRSKRLNKVSYKHIMTISTIYTYIHIHIGRLSWCCGCWLSELMLLGFISLLLTVGQSLISEICVSEAIASTWHPCSNKQEKSKHGDEKDGRRRLLLEFSGSQRRILAAGGDDKCTKKACLALITEIFKIGNRNQPNWANIDWKLKVGLNITTNTATPD